MKKGRVSNTQSRLAAVGIVLLMLAPWEPAAAEPAGVARDASRILYVNGTYVARGAEQWKEVRIGPVGLLKVPEGASLAASRLVSDGGSLEVPGGTLELLATVPGSNAELCGKFRRLDLTLAARLSMNGAAGNASQGSSPGGAAAIWADVTEGATFSRCTLEIVGGDGYSNPEPWAQGKDLMDRTAAGGLATFRVVSSEPAMFNMSDATVRLKAGRGGDAADGKEAGGYEGGDGGGYSNGGNVSEYVGGGGWARLMVGCREVMISGSSITIEAGAGGRGGDGGGDASSKADPLGGGGGGGYSGGDGGGAQPVVLGPAPAAARPGGAVSGEVGSGGHAVLSMEGENVTVRSTGIKVTGGDGGEGGDGGWGSLNCGGGGGGYGGGGGCSYVAGTSGPNPPNAGADGGAVDGSVGSGGDVSVKLRGDGMLSVDWLELYALAGAGGTGGKGGPGGSGGGGGGGGYGGGGGGTASYGTGGDGDISGGTGAGGSAGVRFEGWNMSLGSSDLVVFGGSGGRAGDGGPGGDRAGGGGGGYGGGGGNGNPAGGQYQPGAGRVVGAAGKGGGASMELNSSGDSGGLVARNCTAFVYGGTGGDGGAGGLAGGAGGGGGGYTGGGGAAQLMVVPPGVIGSGPGDGGDAAFAVHHVAPSLSALSHFNSQGGKGGNGEDSKGAGAGGGAGCGRRTSAGAMTRHIPMSVPLLIAPADGELLNEIGPIFEWEHVMDSTTDGGVRGYAIQADDDPGFGSPELDTWVENETSFTPTSELSTGGVYYWRMLAEYEYGKGAGWGPARKLLFNTPPVLTFNIPLVSFPEDTVGYHLINLSKNFRDDLFSDNLSYLITYETDPRHILGEVDGHLLTFSTPTKDWYGRESFAVRATDPMGLWRNSNNFTVRVTPVNDPPEILPLPDVSVTPGLEHRYDLEPFVSDPDTLPSDLTVTADSPFVKVAGLGLVLDFTPEQSRQAVHLVVSDGMCETAADFAVLVERVNQPPVIGGIPPVVTDEDLQFQSDLSQFVGDDTTPPDKVRWAVDSVSAGYPPVFDALIDRDHFLQVLPARGAYGSGSLVLRAVDLDGRHSTRSLAVTVRPVNHPPVIQPVPELGMLAGSSATVEMAQYIRDPDTPLGALLLSAGSPLAAVEGLRVVVTIPADFAGNRTEIDLKVTDGSLESSSVLTVLVRFKPAIVKALPSIRALVGRPVTFDLERYALDRNVPPVALAWELSGPPARCFNASIERDGHTLRLVPLAPGVGTLVVKVRNKYNGTDQGSIDVTVGDPAEDGRAPWDGQRTAGTVLAVAACLGVLFFLFRPRTPVKRAPLPRRVAAVRPGPKG